MKKKILALIIVLFVLVGVTIAIVLNKKEKDINVYNSEEFDWVSKYIWVNDSNIPKTEKKDTWVCFRKNIDIENIKDAKNAIARISVDSKYILYINGEIVVREGGLKRGEKEKSIYYDEVNIGPFLQKGENSIAILVWYWGNTGFSHVDSGMGGLLFQAQIGDDIISSDNSWKAVQNPAFLKDVPLENKRLSEPNIYYNANFAIDNWYGKDFDASNWEEAVETVFAGELPYGELIKRSIPHFKFSGIKSYENSNQYKNYTTNQDELLVLEAPYNMQLLPYLKIEAKKDAKILISNNSEIQKDGIYQKITYIAKEGIQEFETPAWISGEKIYYYIPKGVKILDLGYRETSYDTEIVGKFESDDEFFNDLWTMATRTLLINMRDNYMDCPDRERAVWFGDASVSVQEALYSLNTKANYLYEKDCKTLVGWQHENVLMTNVPHVASTLHLPTQMFISVATMYDYYEYTGNKEFLEKVYPAVKKYLDVWSIKDTGLVSINNYYGLWPWGDSSGVCDYVAIENIGYYYALTTVSKMAEELGLSSDVESLQAKSENLKNAINTHLWKEKGYKEYNDSTFDIRANAFAILSGLADESKYEAISEILINNTENSTFLEKYVLEALCELGYIEESQTRIKTRYKEMVDSQDEFSTTLWEYWEKGHGSKNHAWSGGPLVIMSKYYAGIKPLKTGYEEISIKPQFGNLNKIESFTETVKGNISLEAIKTENEIKLKIDVPARTLVGIEKLNNNSNITINSKKVCKNGKVLKTKLSEFEAEDDKYIYYYLGPGKYTIKSK